MRKMTTAVLLFALATPAMADWKTLQADGSAQARYTGDRYRVEISCTRGSGLDIFLEDMTGRGEQFMGVENLMVWVKLPDGRTDRWPVEVAQHGASLTGRLVVSDFNLDFFHQGETFEIDAPLTGTGFMQGNMVGTGAARLAFLERCGV